MQYYGVDADELRIVVPLEATAIAEMAAGILICCGPPAAIVFRAVRELPIVASWMSLSSKFLGSLGGSRSRFRTLRSNQPLSPSKQANESRSPLRTFGGSIMPGKGVWPVEQPVTDPRGGWTDVEVDAYSLSPLRPVHTEGIGNGTDSNVTRTRY